MTEARILIVEDDNIVAGLLQSMAAHLGYAVPAVVACGRDAVAAADRLRPDLVLMDIRMPGDLDGIDAAEQIRAHLDIPVVFVTGFSDADSLRRSRITEPFGYLTKPVGEHELHSAVETGLYRHSTRKQSEAAMAHRLEMERLVAHLSRHFIQIPFDRLDAEIDAALQSVSEFIGVDRCYLAVLDDDGQRIGAIHEWAGPHLAPATGVMRGLALDGFPWVAGRLRRLEIVHVPSIAALDESAAAERELWQRHGLRSILVIPLARGQTMIGFLGMAMDRCEQSWPEEDIRLLRLVGDILSGVLERHRAEQALVRRTEQLEALRRVGMEIAAHLDLPDLLQSIVSQAIRLLGAQSGGFSLYLPDRDVLQRTVSIGSSMGLGAAPLRRGEGLAGRAWETGQPQLVDDYGQWPGRLPAYADQGIRAALAVPVFWGPLFLGVVDMQATGDHTFTPADAGLLAQLATQAAVAIANARLFEEEQRRRREAEALRAASLALGATLDMEQVLNRLLDQVASVMPYDSANVMWIESGEARILYFRGYEGAGSPQATATFRLTVAATPNLNRLVTTRRPYVVPDTHADPEWRILEATRWIRSWAGAPIVVQGEVVGVFSVASPTPGFYTPDQADLLAAFAAHAAVAVENARLYETLRQRIAELQRTQAQLVQSAKMAAVGELAAGVAHELNNPLTAVLGFAELLLWSVPPGGGGAAFRDDLSTIMAEARRARDIVAALLDFSRQTETVFHPDDLNQVVKDTLALVRRQIARGGVRLEESYAPDLPVILLSSSRLKQVILNLITNALHAMPDGGRLSICTQRSDDGLAVHIADTGTGIPPDVMPRIFEPFFTTKPVGQGTGLGLSVSLGIVQEHGGRLAVQSQPGAGSTFSVWLPIRMAATHPAGDPS